MNKNAKNNKHLTSTAEAIDRRMEQVQFHSALTSVITKIVIVILAAVLVFTFIFGVNIQNGEGMFPRMRDGDIVLWYRLTENFQVGDIITLTRDSVRYTGRVVAVGGDTIDTSDSGDLIVNGAIQYEEIYYETYKEASVLSYPYTVPENSYFILGDMRTGAEDSRDIGAVSGAEVDGKVITIIRRRGL